MTASALPLHGERVETRERIRLVPFDKIKLGTERRYLVKGLIPREGLTLLWGPPKCGKSFWATDLALHIALGWDYRGRKVVGGPAVYCAFEGAFGFGARIEAFRQKFLAEDAAGVRFFLVPITLDLVRDQKELVAAIRATLGNARPATVVLDTLNRSLNGSESSDEDMGAYVKAADAIREEFRCAIIVVHHCGINDSRPRGHTSLTGAADAQLAVKRDEANNIIVTVEWMKDGQEGDYLVSSLEVVEIGLDEDGEPISSCVIVPVEGMAPTRKKPKLAPVPRAGLRYLHEIIAEAGQAAPPSSHIPTGVKGVTSMAWRDRLEKVGIINPEGNPREQFKRIRVTLLNEGAIGIWEDFVWAVTLRHIASQ